MGQFYPLFKKNWILFKRNLAGSIFEMLFPILFALILGITTKLKTTTEKNNYSYLNLPKFAINYYPTDFTNWNTAFNPAFNTTWHKNCAMLKTDGKEDNRRGGKIGLAPDNA